MSQSCEAENFAKQIFLTSNIKQTTSQIAYILYESLAGNQRNPLSKLFLVSNLPLMFPMYQGDGGIPRPPGLSSNIVFLDPTALLISF